MSSRMSSSRGAVVLTAELRSASVSAPLSVPKIVSSAASSLVHWLSRIVSNLPGLVSRASRADTSAWTFSIVFTASSTKFAPSSLAIPEPSRSPKENMPLPSSSLPVKMMCVRSSFPGVSGSLALNIGSVMLPILRSV